MSDIGLPSSIQPDDDVLESLADFERNTSDSVKRSRTSTRVRVKSKVVAQPGNSGDRLKFKIQGVTGDVSTGGCQILFPIPLRVGDIYWLTFDRQQLKLDSIFARCLRCRLIREDAYEAGFKFFDPIDLSAATPTQTSDSLFD